LQGPALSANPEHWSCKTSNKKELNWNQRKIKIKEKVCIMTNLNSRKSV